MDTFPIEDKHGSTVPNEPIVAGLRSLVNEGQCGVNESESSCLKLEVRSGN